MTATLYLAWLLWGETSDDNAVSVKPDRRQRRFVLSGGMALCQAGAMLTHNVAAVFLPLILNVAAFGLLWRRRRRFPLRRWIGTQLAALLLWSPWALPFVVQAQGVDRRFWLPSPTLADLIDA